MSEGKKVSQAGHAFLGSFILSDRETQLKYHTNYPQSPGTKVCLQVDNLDQLLLAENAAKEIGLSFFKVVDSGCKNFFNGQPIVTALGIGPATMGQIKHITGKFKLL